MGTSVMITPAACVPTLRVTPSISEAVVTNSVSLGSARTASLNSGISSRQLFNVMDFPLTGILIPAGISLQIRSTSDKGISITRPTSRMAPFAPSVLKVIICETRSAPYLSEQYCSILYRWSSWISRSISGIEILSGFKKRSKINLNFNGSTGVIPNT